MSHKTIRTFLLLLIALSTVVATAYALTPRKQKKKAQAAWFDGIDVSHHQGRIDWKRVAKDKRVRFVYIKATQGTTIVDERYKYNNRNARKHGILCGAYLYFSSSSSVRDQFKAFTRVVKKKDQDLIPAIDVEREGMKHWTPKQVRNNLQQMCRLMKNYYGKSPIIYSQYVYYNERLAPYFNHYLLFLAKYSKGKPVIIGKGRNNIWQFTERGLINGINGRVDLNRLMGNTSLKTLKLR